MSNDDFVLLILSSPSGAGKTTLKTRILTESHPELRFSVSHTTRKPRANEIDGREKVPVEGAPPHRGPPRAPLWGLAHPAQATRQGDRGARVPLRGPGRVSG